MILALLGCGGDDEPATTAETRSETDAETQTQDTAAETQTESENEADETEATEEVPPPTAEEPPTKTSGSPEEEPGGAGDEEPARSLALFTGKGGRITPRVVRVPSFISIRVELRSADGRRYGLTFGQTTIRAGGGLGSVSTTMDGLRPGMGVIGVPSGASNRVRIEATAEPGP